MKLCCSRTMLFCTGVHIKSHYVRLAHVTSTNTFLMFSEMLATQLCAFLRKIVFDVIVKPYYGKLALLANIKNN